MSKPNIQIVSLSALEPEQEADAFVVLAEKELVTPKKGEPFFRTVFRDAEKEYPSVPIWVGSQLYTECQKKWKPGEFYKIRTKLRKTEKYGLQLEIHRIREIMDGDEKDGFDPNKCLPSSRIPSDAMYEEILALAKTHIGKGKLLNLVTRIFKDHREALLVSAASRNHHHDFSGGLLEHTLSVTKTAIFLADHYTAAYPKLLVPFSKPLVVTGAILHDLGKLRSLKTETMSSHNTLEGELIGYTVLGRDLVRDYGKLVELDQKTQTHLEHIILSHPQFPDWGAAQAPKSLESVLVHAADSCDALFGSYVNVLLKDETPGEITSTKTLLGFPLFRG